MKRDRLTPRCVLLPAKDPILLFSSNPTPSSLSDFRGHTERASLVYGESI